MSTVGPTRSSFDRTDFCKQTYEFEEDSLGVNTGVIPPYPPSPAGNEAIIHVSTATIVYEELVLRKHGLKIHTLEQCQTHNGPRVGA